MQLPCRAGPAAWFAANNHSCGTRRFLPPLAPPLAPSVSPPADVGYMDVVTNSSTCDLDWVRMEQFTPVV